MTRARFRQPARNWESSLSPFFVLVSKVERGDGTLGKLVTHDDLYQRADKVLTDVEALLADVKKNPSRYL